MHGVGSLFTMISWDLLSLLCFAAGKSSRRPATFLFSGKIRVATRPMAMVCRRREDPVLDSDSVHNFPVWKLMYINVTVREKRKKYALVGLSLCGVSCLS